ncbi:MAG: glycerophosphodiester phosphodiesterase [Bacilli bacterium]
MKRFHKQLIVAHRGASGLVEHENTLEAFTKAIEVQADCIELDVRKTKDQQMVVIHDDNIQGNLVKDLNYVDLLAITDNLGYHLPLLKEALVLVKGKIMVDVEIKEVGYEKELIDLIHQHLNNDEFMMRSFEDEALLAVKKYDKQIVTALLLGKEKPKHVLWTRLTELFPAFRLWRCRADYVSPYYRLLRLCYVARMQFIKKPVSVWTVNDQDMIRKYLKMKVSSLVTNYPDLGLKIREELATTKK